MRLPFLKLNTMSYKHTCSCGKHDCTCHNHFVDLSCMETQPYDEAQTLLGLTNCGKVVSVEKPQAELSELDREKLDLLEVDGPGNSALYNDGTYKETYTKVQTDDAIRTELKDAVFYTEKNNIEPRADVILGRNNEIRAKNSDGTEYNLVQATTIGITNYGDTTKLTNLVSSSRPVAQLSGESVTQVHPIAFVEDVKAVSDKLNSFQTDTENNLAKVNEKIDTLESGVDSLRISTTARFDAVNSRVDNLESRVTTNEKNITINTSDITALRENINAQDKFKGYFQKNVEIQVIPGESGAYAWSAESGTVWVYDGNSWIDSGTPIPDQTVEAHHGIPLMDGIADAGSSNEYARGDHRHPTDTTRAAASDLTNYLLLAGNTQATRMTGDIWLSSSKALRLSDTGSNFLVQNSELQQTQIMASGIGGVNIQTSSGTAKYNGVEIATVNDVSNVSGDVSSLANTVSSIDVRVSQNESDISALQDAVESAEHFRGYFATTAEITSLAGESGAFAWNGQTGTVWVYKTSIPSWVDTGEPIPAETPYDGLPEMDGTAYAGNISEYSRGNHVHPTDTSRASVAALSVLEGTVSSQATRLSAAESSLSALQTSVSGNTTDITVLQSSVSSQGSRISTLETNVFDLQGRTSANTSAVSTLQSNVATNSADIQTLVGNVASNTTAIGTLQSAISTSTANIAALDSRVSTNESNIATNASDIQGILDTLAGHEKFRGYFQTTAEVTAIANPEVGDYAWNGQTNTVWTYNGITWSDSGKALPDVIVAASDAAPLMDDIADAGSSNKYSRGDHRHPTDTSRASAADVTTLENTVSNLNTFISELRTDVDANTSGVSGNASAIKTLQSNLSTAQNDISSLQQNVATHEAVISSVQNDVTYLSENKVDNLGGVSAIITLSTDQEAEVYSANNPNILVISTQV